MTRQWKVIALCFCFAAVAVGSAWTAPNVGASLKERAKTLWNARVAGDWATEYDFLPVQETRNKTKEAFVASRQEKGPIHFVSAEVGEEAVAGDTGWVEIKYAARPKEYPELPPQHVHTWDMWYMRDGQWYPMTKEQRQQFPTLPPHRRPAEEEALLSSRVQEFWKAREGQDWARIYQFLTPQYRSQVPAEQFTPPSKIPVSYLSHRVEWAEVIGEQGRVKVAFTYRINDPNTAETGPKEDSKIEEWTRAEGQWYRQRP